jgi:Flp pilus assembly protein TadD
MADKFKMRTGLNENLVSSPNIHILACILLCIMVLTVYGSVQHFDFVFYDDHVYIMDRPEVASGLTIRGIRWALTSTDAGFWHPVTWVSLMADYQLYGMNPGGFHITNLIFHLANTLLLYWMLMSMTGSAWRSGVVAALFAVHPLHVESVAWIAERKDVLSTFFMFWTILGYVFYVRHPRVLAYIAVMLLFVLGIMSKPMLVTLPLLLMLLDYWPLGRFASADEKIVSHPPSCTGLGCHRNGYRPVFLSLLMEKVPLFVVSAGVGILTVFTEHKVGAVKSFDHFPFFVRLFNTLISYTAYLRITILPVNLAVFYPHPRTWPIGTVIFSIALLTLITGVALQCRRSHPYILVGWLWYVVALLPVSGLIQIGDHAMADRYTYVPLVGIFLVIAWGQHDLAKTFSFGKYLLGALMGAAIILLMLLAFVQLSYWRDARSLFDHAAEVTENNYLAYNNLGAALLREGDTQGAAVALTKALKIRPHYAEAYFNMGLAMESKKRWWDAEQSYRKALEFSPAFAEAHNNLGILHTRDGRLEDAIKQFQEALRIRPGYQAAQKNLELAKKELQEKTVPLSMQKNRSR